MDRLAHNLRCIEDGLAAAGFTPERRFPTGGQLYVSLEQAVVSVAALSSDDGAWIVIYGTLPVRMPVERRVADIDPPTPELVQRLVRYVLYVWGRCHRPLMQVAYGGASPEDAARDALAVQGVGQADDPSACGDASEPPNVDAILEVMGLTGPIGSLPGEQQADPATPSVAVHEAGMRDVVRKFEQKLGRIPGRGREETPPPLPFPNAYVVLGARLIAGEYPGAKDLPAARAKVRALLDAGVTHVIDLTCPGELTPYAELLAEEASARGLPQVHHRRRPIRDVDVCTVEQMRIILDEIDTALAAGGTVYVHCWGGVGRTGVVVGCWLVRHGRSGSEALAEVRRLFGTMSREKLARHPEGSPQTAAQRRMVLEWSATDSVHHHSEPGSGL